MNIALIIDDYLPESTKSGARMMHDLALHLSGSGHKVLVIAPESGLKGKYKKKTVDGVRIYSFKSGPTKDVNKIVRAINESLLSLQAIKNLPNEIYRMPIDLIVYYSPSIFWGGLVSYLKWKWNCRSYLILRDIFPQWAVDIGLISKNSIFYLYFKFFEFISYLAADRIGLQSPGVELHFQNYSSIFKEKLEILYNWGGERKKKRVYLAWREKLNLHSKLIFFFGGNIGHAQDMMNIVRLADNLKSFSDPHFLIVGKGDEVTLIKREINKRKLKNITLHPAVPYDEYFQILKEVDIGLFSLHKDHNTPNIPGKLLGYMEFSIPILGSVNVSNEVKKIIEKYDAGLVSVNGDDRSFLDNALLLLNDETYRMKLGKNGNDLLKKLFSVQRAGKQILKALDI